MKWYFGLNAASANSETGRHARLALISALAIGGLEPHCLYAGERDTFTDWLEARGVHVHLVFPRFAQIIRDRAAAGAYSLDFMGHWLRSQICLIENEVPMVLYTDCDVVFLQPVAFGEVPPQTIACAPEFRLDEWRYFNSGVMLMNLERLRRDYLAFEAFAIAGINSNESWGFRDQAAYNGFYRQRWSPLEPRFNWKAYWGPSEDAAILHFHGPKFGFIRAIADGLDWTTNPVNLQVGSLLVGSIPSYLDYLRRCEAICGEEEEMAGFLAELRETLAVFEPKADVSKADTSFFSRPRTLLDPTPTPTPLQPSAASNNRPDHSRQAQPPRSVDVAICVYGKPYQTATALASLLEHSGQHIDRIYFQEERNQPFGENVSYLPRCFSEQNIIHFKPKFHLGTEATNRKRLFEIDYRSSIRYQHAWEQTDKRYLFVMHNDCLFDSDIVGGMLGKLEDQTFTGVGLIGQCWNCPAYSAKVCNGDIYESYKPTAEEAMRLAQQYPSPRTSAENINLASPMPLPECRLNEFACLINVRMVRHLIYPLGTLEPFGAFGLDTGTGWFRSLTLRGYRFLNWKQGFIHAWCSETGNGFSSDKDFDIYSRDEEKAAKYLQLHHRALFNRMVERKRSLFVDMV
jgi:Glycosyl transferase family 8